METPRLKALLLNAAALALVSPCFATGGDWFESPAKFPDTLDMLPGKSLGEIFLETTTPASDNQDVEIKEAARALTQRFGHEPLPSLLKQADQWIAQARRQRDNSACNLAHDLHDAVAVSGADASGAKEYVLWRIDHPELTGENVENRAEAAKGAIKANWLFACGASSFSGGDRTECLKWFARVLKEFPKSPRAELALFMQGRCAFSASRAENAEPAAREKAVALYNAYLKKYPQGAYKSDALGWLGALAFDGEKYQKALEYYIAQAEVPGHPETLPTAVYNCERALARVAANPAALDLIAKHPRVAMAFAYLVLSAPEADNYDGKYDNPAEVKKWRRTMLPKLAAAVAKQKDSYKSTDWQPRYLAMLVQAASASGNQPQALQLSQIAPDQLTKSDDLLFARAIVLQRANKTPEAIELFQKFLALFPKSPMRPGVSLRLALALQDNHQAGKALTALCRLLPRQKDYAEATASPAPTKTGDADEDEATEKKAPAAELNLGERYTDGQGYPASETDWQMSESSVYPNLSGADEDQIQQFMDALVNFAPLSEIEAVVDDPAFDETEKRELRAILTDRYLAAEDFGKARKYVRFTEHTDEQLRLAKAIDSLAGLTTAANQAGTQQAEKMMQLGSTWADLRGQILRAPLGTRTGFSGRHWDYDPLTKRNNGLALGQAKVDEQLDDLDELHHAARWWMRAARLVPGKPLAAKARLLALETMPKMARASTYGETRAREIGASKVSREIYDKLRGESPQSIEATQAAYWSVPDTTPLHEHDPWSTDMPVRYLWPFTCSDGSAPLGYPFSDGRAFEKIAALDPDRNDQRTGSPQNLEERVKALRGSSKTLEPPELLKEVQSLATDLRSAATGPEDAGGVNCMEDLAQFLSEPGMTKEAAGIYVDLRLDLLHRARAALPDPGMADTNPKNDTDEAVAAEIDEAEKNKAFSSLHDYLDFCRIGLVSGARFDVDTDIKDPKDAEHPITYISRDFKKLQAMTQEFLKKYPKSKKHEPALFVFARATYGASCPYFICVGVPLPGYEPSEGVADTKLVPYFQEPLDPKKIFAALDEYDRAYPNGRYAADIHNMRAATQWRSAEWEGALKETIAQIKDQSHPELQSEAGVRLANIFAELANPEHRRGVLTAIQANSEALPYLQAYAVAAYGDQAHPLRYLQAFLIDQFHIQIPKPAEDVAAAR